MIAALNTPARRITLAIALSLPVHAAILWLPYVQFPRTKIELPAAFRQDRTSAQSQGYRYADSGEG